MAEATRKFTSWSFVVALMMLGGCAADGDAEAARVEIAEPADGETVSGAETRVVLRTYGAQVEPADNRQTAGRGHHHLFIDRDASPAGEPIPPTGNGVVHMGDGAEEYVLTDLTPGEHRVIAQLAYGDHTPMEEVAADTVTFTVQP